MEDGRVEVEVREVEKCPVEPKKTEGATELTALEMFGGELRWMKMDSDDDQIIFLLEERRLEDEYHRRRMLWKPRVREDVDQDPEEQEHLMDEQITMELELERGGMGVGRVGVF